MLADVSWREESGYAVVRVTGEVDAAVVDEIKASFDDAAAASRHLVVDLTGVDFIGSTGINLLVRAYNTVRRSDGWLRLVYVDGAVAKVLRTSGLLEVLPAYGSVEDAGRG